MSLKEVEEEQRKLQSAIQSLFPIDDDRVQREGGSYFGRE